MKATYVEGNVRANCPDCDGALSTFYSKDESRREHGCVARSGSFNHEGVRYPNVAYRLMKCGGCGRGALAKVYYGSTVNDGTLVNFTPTSRDFAQIPDNTPEGVVSEYREAELCASVGAWRGASALLRSALEKTLRANGYVKGNLADRIDEAASDGVITQARQRRAHEDVRVFGNDILHDDWRPVSSEEYGAAHHYVQRIIEDFYDQRDEVEAVLLAAGRIKPQDTGQAGDDE